MIMEKTAFDILREHTPYKGLQFQTWVEQGILRAMKEIAEQSWAEGFKESTTWFGGETLPESQLDGGKNYYKAKNAFIQQLFGDVEQTEKAKEPSNDRKQDNNVNY